MILIYIWLAYIIIGATLLIGKAITCRLLGIYQHHYQLGYSPRVVHFKLLGVTISLGIIIPFPWLFKIFVVEGNKKQRIIPLWMRRDISAIKRMVGIGGGVILLYLFSLLLFALNISTTNSKYLSLDEVNKHGVYVNGQGEELGLRSGDKIIKINDEKPERFAELMYYLFTEDVQHLEVIRNDSVIDVVVSNWKPDFSSGGQVISPISVTYPFVIDSVLIGKSAYNAGLSSGDKIISINGDSIFYFQEVVQLLEEKSNNKLILGINRNGQDKLIPVEVNIDEFGKLGVVMEQSLKYTKVKKSFLQSLNSGNVFVKNYLISIKNLFVQEPEINHFGGFRSVGNLFPQNRENWRIFSMFLLSYVCLSFFPTPFTEGRFLFAIFIDKIYRLPRYAPSLISWIVLMTLLLIANIKDLIRFL